MLVRFNKGPWHRRLQEMDVREVEKGVVQVAISAPGINRVFDQGPDRKLMVYNHKIAVYRIKMIRLDFGNGVRVFPSVFPDGAICFEHTETY